MIDPRIQNYCRQNGYTVQDIIAQDASTRDYYRLSKNGSKNDHTVIIMADDPTMQTRAGYRLVDCITVGDWLRSIDINVPDIYDVDHENLLLVQQDFGTVDFKTALKNGENAQTLYNIAHNVITRINAQPPPDLPQYYDSHIHQAHRQIIDYYVPTVLQRPNPKGLRDAYWGVWQDIESQFKKPKSVFSHVDFHLENLMWLPHEKGHHQCGVIDFQTSMIGPEPYTLVNLLNDARSDTPPDIYQNVMNQYDENFQTWFTILSAQFHARVIGVFIKFAVVNNKPKYLDHIPRLQAYMTRHLNHPALAPLKTFFDDIGVDFSVPYDIDLAAAKGYVDNSYDQPN